MKTYRHSLNVTYPSLLQSMSLKNSASLALLTVRPAVRNAIWSSFKSTLPSPFLSTLWKSSNSFRSARWTNALNSIARVNLVPWNCAQSVPSY